MVWQELRMQRKSFIGFTVGMLVVFSMFLFFFDSFKEDAALLDLLLKNFPDEFKAAFGFSDVNLSEFIGYMSFLFSYLVLIGAVFGMKIGVGALSEEYRAKTSDFLLSKPIQRKAIVTAKLEAALIMLLAQNLIVYGYALIFSTLVISENIDYKLFSLIVGSLLGVQLFFVGIGFLVSVTLPRIKNVMPITLGLVFIFFIIELINQSIMDKKLAYLTPFAYFKGSEIIKTGGYSMVFVSLVALVFCLSMVLTYRIYDKKDIKAV